MDKKHCYCVIMAGGSGSRLWPVSRTSLPKQFLDVAYTGETFLRQTYNRFKNLIPQENIIISTAEKYKNLVLEQLPELNEMNIIVEPYIRNTAPAIAYSTYVLLKRDPDAMVMVTPSDHLIKDNDLFGETIENIFKYLKEHDVLMTLGVVPTRPDTNFGYIQACGGKDALKNDAPVKVKTFTEKPDKELAEVFVASGEFFWNAGVFVGRAERIRKEMEEHLPEISKLFKGWEHAIGTDKENEFINKVYIDCPNISIDFGIMERTEKAWIYPVKFKWADIGSWDTLFNEIPKTDNGNAYFVKNHIDKTTENSMIVSTNKEKLIVLKGLENYMVIDTDDVLVICPREEKQFKDLIADIAMPDYEKFR